MTDLGAMPLLPPEMCRVCFHVHSSPIGWCAADEWAPGPDGDASLGLCHCVENVTLDVESRMTIEPCDRPECEHPNSHMHSVRHD